MAGPCSFQDLSSPAKDRTHAPLQWKCRALTTRLVGYPSRFLCLNPTSSSSAASNYLQVLSVFLSFFFFFFFAVGQGWGLFGFFIYLLGSVFLSKNILTPPSSFYFHHHYHYHNHYHSSPSFHPLSDCCNSLQIGLTII